MKSNKGETKTCHLIVSQHHKISKLKRKNKSLQGRLDVAQLNSDIYSYIIESLQKKGRILWNEVDMLKQEYIKSL